MITSLSELYFRIRRFIPLVQTKRVISMNYGSSTSSQKPQKWMRLDLIFSLRDIYINSNPNPLTKFTSSSRSTNLKDILPWNISQMIMKTIPISTRIVISYAMKWGILLWNWWKVNGNWDNNMIKISQWRERNKSKRAGIWESQSGICIGKLTIWVRSFEIIAVLLQSSPGQVDQFHQNRWASPYDGR